jgi:hypothetical protein
MRNTLSMIVSASAVLCAQTPTTIRVSSETAPVGGVAQVKVLLTSPQPITGGGVSFDGALGTADGISLFSPTGDVFGAAVQNGSNVSVRFVSPNGTFGTNTDYPILTVTFGVGTTCFRGEILPVSLGSSSWWQNALGSTVPMELKPGTITIGGSVSITNVVPGGGELPAGGTFDILGMNFSPKTQVQLSNAQGSSITYLNSGAIRVTLKNATRMDGVGIQVKNPDGSSDKYFSYLRGVPVGASANPLIAPAVPIFSTLTSSSWTLGPMMLPQFNSPYALGLALQNPGAADANVTLELHTVPGPPAAAVTLTLGPGLKISREISEWFGTALPSGAYVRVVSDQPVQALGLLANSTDGSVMPVGLARN